MAKKLILVSPVLVCAAVITALVLSGVGGARQDATPAELEQAKVNIVSLIKSGDYVGTDAAIKKLKADFALDTNLPDALYWLAGEFRWVRQYDRAGNLYNELAVEYGTDPIGRRASLGEANVDVLALIDANEFSLAQAALSQLGTDFAGDAGLAEAVYWITKEFEWAKSAAEDRATRYDIPRALYQRISRQFVGSPRASDAEWDYKRLTHRTNILTLIASGNSDQNEIDAAIAAMEADFADRPDLILEGLYWIGREYEQYPDGADRAREFYERIAVEFPDIPDEANAATMDAVRAAIDVEQRTGKEGQAQETIARLRQRLEGTPRLAYTLYWAAGAYRREAAICERLGTADAFATACLEKAAGLYTEVTELAADSSLAGKAYFFLGGCYRRLQKFSDALGCYRQVQKNWPASQLDAQCLEGISVCYEQLGEQGCVDSSEADDRIEQVYKELVEKYPDSPQGTEALLKLGWLTFRQDRMAEAISYFEKGLAEFPADSKPEDVLYVLARMYEKTGDKPKAIATYRQLVSLLEDGSSEEQKVKMRIMLLEDTGVP